MKTLIINGSPKKDGDVAALLDMFMSRIAGDVLLLSTEDRIQPCSDCRFCWSNPGCAIMDDMQRAYAWLEDCDCIVLASPIWFSSLSGPMLTICSRFQSLYAAVRFRGEQPRTECRHGVLLLAGAEPGTELNPAANALTIMKHMGVQRSGVSMICSMNTNQVPACMDDDAMNRTREAAERINGLVGGSAKTTGYRDQRNS